MYLKNDKEILTTDNDNDNNEDTAPSTNYPTLRIQKFCY